MSITLTWLEEPRPADPTGALRDEGWAEGLGAQCAHQRQLSQLFPAFVWGATGATTAVAKLKADAQKVVSIIKGDEAKTQTFCQMGILGNQVDEAIQKQDTNKAYELTQKLTELEKDLGSEYFALFESLRSLDLTSKDGQEIMSVFDKLDESCPH